MNHYSPSAGHTPNRPGLLQLALAGVLLAGFLIRLYSFLSTPVINPDGTLYIQQAKALHHGLYGSITSCFQYLSNYPVLIAGAYRILGDWVVAAKSVSLIFGVLTFIPLYFLLRRFFDQTASILCLLIFALMPDFVALSRDVIRGPIFWFCTVAGLYLFVLHIEKEKYFYLLLSCLAFLMAAWARIEGMLFICVSTLYLLLSKQDNKAKRLFFFLAPFAVVAVLGTIYLLHFDRTLLGIFAPQRIMERALGVIRNYQGVRRNLAALIDSSPPGFSPYFFPEVRNLVWLIALGSLAVQVVRTLFFPFCFVFFLGVWGSGGRIRKDRRLIYLCSLAIAAVLVLYFQVLFNWAMSSRFIGLILFPAFFFIGIGLQKIADFFKSGFKMRGAVVHVVLALLILAAGLPKNLKSDRRDEKIVFKEIGQFIAAREENRREVSVSGNFKYLRLVHFYAHLDYPGAPCFDPRSILSDANMKTPYRRGEKVFDYFIWDRKNSRPPSPPQNTLRGEPAFKRLNEWQSRKLGPLILYAVKSNHG